MTLSKTTATFLRTLAIRTILGLAIAGGYLVLDISAPGLAGTLAVAIPAVLLFRRALRSIPASRRAMLLSGGAVALTIIAQTSLLGSGIGAAVVSTAIIGGGFGLVLGLLLRPKWTNAGPVIPGLALPLVGWQLSIILTQAIALTGLVNVVRLLVMVQGFFAGLAGTACLAALVPLTFRRASIAQKSTPVILSRLGMILILVLTAMTVGQSGRSASQGLFEGGLDPEILQQRIDMNAEEGWPLRVTASPIRVRIHPDGSAELANEASCTIDWTMGSSREIREFKFRPAGRAGPGELTVNCDEVITHHQGRDRFNREARTTRERRSVLVSGCRVQPQSDGTVLVYLKISYTEMIRDIPWRCQYVGEAAGRAAQSPGSGSGFSGGGNSLKQIVAELGLQQDIGDQAGKAGLIAGLLALLAGASLDLAGLLASGAAAAAIVPPPPQVHTPGARVLSGDDARQWLKRNGFIDGAGRFTEGYRQWADRLYDEEDLSPLQLIQYYGHSESAGPGRIDPFLPADADLDIMVKGDPGTVPIPTPPAPAPAPEGTAPVPPVPVTPTPLPEPPKLMKEPPPPDPDPPKPLPDPCIEEVTRLAGIQRTGEALIREMKYLRGQMEAIRTENHALEFTGRVGFGVDVLSSGFTIVATSMGGPMASLPVSLVQNLVADTVKSCVHQIYREDPSNFGTNLICSETVATIASRIGDRLKKKLIDSGVGLSANPTFFADLNQKLRLNAGGLLQVAYTAGMGTYNFRRNRIQVDQLNQRLKTLAGLRKKTNALVVAERARRDNARVDLAACRARHAIPGGTAP